MFIDVYLCLELVNWLVFFYCRISYINNLIIIFILFS